MPGIRYKAAGLGLGLAVLFSALNLSAIGRADTNNQTTDWYTHTPTLSQTVSYITAPEFTNDDCKPTTLKVSRGVGTNFEDYCVTQMPLGMFEKTGKVIQPSGYTTAYPISYKAGGGVILTPIPNQSSALQVRGYSAGPGVTLGLYNDITKNMKLKSDTTGTYYAIEGTDTFSEYVWRYSGGELLRLNSATMSISSNGRYIIADSIWSGFVRIDLTDMSVKPLADSLVRMSSDSLLPAFTRISDDGATAVIAYNAPDNWGDMYFKVVDVNSCSNAMPATSSTKLTASCRSSDVLASVKQSLPTLDAIGTVRFANNHTITFTARYKNEAGQYRYADFAMTANGWPKRIKQYLALGDSYISGEGALSYRGGTDTPDNHCHQSLVSYPYLLGATTDSFASVACSGARLHNITDPLPKSEKRFQVITPPNEGVEKDALSLHNPGYIFQKTFVTTDDPEVVTISIGGNDIGFGKILERCVHPMKYLSDNAETASTCFDTYEDRAETVNLINSQFARLRDLYADLKQGQAGERRVYVVGYPQITKVGGSCGLNVQMNEDEIKFGHDLIAYLDSVIERAANEAGVQYVDTQHAFDGYRLCEAPAGMAAVNGFTISQKPGGGHDFSASFHPNKRGHQLFADAIRAQTANLTKPMPAATAKTNEIAFKPQLDILRNVPKTNRPLRYVKIVEHLAEDIVNKGLPIKIALDNQDFFLKPNNQYEVVINSQPVSLGKFQSDAQGNLNISTAIPTNMPAGFHTLHVYGTDVFGNALDMQDVVYVATSDNDRDGDGVTNQDDSCIYAAQSGSDSDQDHIDDVCDPLIGAAPTANPNQEPEGIIWLNNAILPITIQASTGP